MKLKKYIFLVFLPCLIGTSVNAQDSTIDSGVVSEDSNKETIDSSSQSIQPNQSVNNGSVQSSVPQSSIEITEQITESQVPENGGILINDQSNTQTNQNSQIKTDSNQSTKSKQPVSQVNIIDQNDQKPTSIPIKPQVSQIPNHDWINNQADNLNKNGVFKMPSQVDYDSLVSQKDFAIMLSKVTGIKDKTIFGDLDIQGFDKPLSRAMAIDSALRAFGLEKEMNKVVDNYQTKFKDLNPEQKYYKASLTAEIIKLSAGYPDRTFRPDDLLKWSEGVAIVESVYRWASLMPEQTPIQKAEDLRKNIWYYFIDGFRLILTSVYCLLSIIFLVRAWRRSKDDRTGLRPIIASLCFATTFLFIMWLNEMLYGRGLIDKPAYYIISTISILSGMFLIRTSNLISKQTEPKPKANIEVGYVDHIDMSRGEMFVIDSITKRRMLALISSETKVYSKENRLLGAAFLSELSAGDFVSVKGTEQIAGGAMIDVDMILVLASKQANVNTRQQKQVIEETEEKQIQARYRKVI